MCVFKGMYYFDVYLVFFFSVVIERLGGGWFACADTYKIVTHVVTTFIGFYTKEFQLLGMHN